MEFPKLILVQKNRGVSKSTRLIWKIKAKIDSNQNKVTLIIESGELGSRMNSQEKILRNIKLSSKKGML